MQDSKRAFRAGQASTEAQKSILLAALAALLAAVWLLEWVGEVSSRREAERSTQTVSSKTASSKTASPAVAGLPADQTDVASEPAKEESSNPLPQRSDQTESPEWRRLFNGESLDGWEVTNFGGEGPVHVDDGKLILELGSNLTGVTATQSVPKTNYEVALEAMRVGGTDFFCGLTFPVKDDPCSLIIGGWGGGVCGLSCIDGLDASQNDTATYQAFENGRWYRIRLRVTDEKIEAWLDGEQIVDQDLTGREISIRTEVAPSQPFGIASWQTTAALRNIRIRRLQDSSPAKQP